MILLDAIYTITSLSLIIPVSVVLFMIYLPYLFEQLLHKYTTPTDKEAGKERSTRFLTP